MNVIQAFSFWCKKIICAYKNDLTLRRKVIHYRILKHITYLRRTGEMSEQQFNQSIELLRQANPELIQEFEVLSNRV